MNKLKRRKMPQMRRTLGVIFQDFRLIDKMTVYDNVAFAMRVVGATNKAIKDRVPRVLELVGLEGREKRLPAELSGGEQQRVAIARALVNNPTMIIADEPTGNLDPVRSLELMLLLEKINDTCGYSRKGTGQCFLKARNSHRRRPPYQRRNGRVLQL